MTLTFASLLEMTKLFIRDPRTAATLVKAAKLPLEVSVLMIVLAGVVTGVASGVLDAVVGNEPVVSEFADGQTATFIKSGPVVQGVYAAALGLALGFALFQVGTRMDGRGSLADMMGITAVLQLVLAVIVVLRTALFLLVPLLGFALMLFGAYVFLRGLGHTVKVGHEYESMGKSVGVIVVSFIAVVVLSGVLTAATGIGPVGEIK